MAMWRGRGGRRGRSALQSISARVIKGGASLKAGLRDSLSGTI